MTEIFAVGRTLPEAYHHALIGLHRYGSIVNCPAYKTRCLECGLTMVVNEPLTEPMISRFFPGGPEDLEQYTEEILDGILDFEVDVGNWAYTYHSRTTEYPVGTKTKWCSGFPGFYNAPIQLNQIEFVLNELRRDPNSRRAVIDVRYNLEDACSKASDPACLQHIQYFIRENCLNCSVLFRSNDSLEATFMNAYALIRLQERLAKELGVGMGTYTHRANSFHCYEKDWTALSGAVARLNTCWLDGPTTTYRYAGDWDAMMEEAKPVIQAKVNKLKQERGLL